MSFTIVGRVYEVESGLGVQSLHVSAFDKDPKGRNALGEALSDESGRFRLSYERQDFDARGEGGPDLYLELRGCGSRTLIHSTEAQVRKNASALERFSLGLSRETLGAFSPSARPGHGARRERLSVELRDDSGRAIEGKRMALVTEHKANAKRQHKRVAEGAAPLEYDLGPGSYTVQGFARGYDVASALAEVRPGAVSHVALTLKKVGDDHFKRTPAQRLAAYGLDEHQVRLAPLTLERGQTLVLDGRKNPDLQGLVRLKPKSARELKRFVGSKDQVFGHEQPRFGRISNLCEEVLSFKGGKKETDKLSAGARQQIVAIAREYVHGNSVSVGQFESVIDHFVVQAIRPEILAIFVGVVTIGPGATLTVGQNSNLFWATVLRMHTTGKLKIVGDCKLDIGRLERFS